MADAVEFIRRNVEWGVDVDAVAGFMRCSRRYAQRRFSNVLGRTVSEEIAAARLERAKELLLQVHQSLGAIAHLCGYKDESAMRRLFRSATGMSMHEWRRHRQSTPTPECDNYEL